MVTHGYSCFQAVWIIAATNLKKKATRGHWVSQVLQQGNVHWTITVTVCEKIAGWSVKSFFWAQKFEFHNSCPPWNISPPPPGKFPSYATGLTTIWQHRSGMFIASRIVARLINRLWLLQTESEERKERDGCIQYLWQLVTFPVHFEIVQRWLQPVIIHQKLILRNGFSVIWTRPVFSVYFQESSL